MKLSIQIVFLFLAFSSCKKDDISIAEPENDISKYISSVDISNYPEIFNSDPTFYDLEGNQNDFLNILKENGINTVRLRIWVNPNSEHSGFNEVKQFSQTLKTIGFKTWLTIHYSYTWTDPSHQETPTQWQGISFAQLKDSVYNYTEKLWTNYNQIIFKLVMKLILDFFILMGIFQIILIIL